MRMTRQITLGLAAAALLAGVSPVTAAKPQDGVTAAFGAGRLTVNGDNRDNVIVVSRDAAGTILVNGGAVVVQGGLPTVANTSLIRILGHKGNDELRLDESNGALPRGQLLGHAGDDTLVGGSGADELDGGPGNDTLRGSGGVDVLIGGDGHDTLIGGAGDDLLYGGTGDDDFVWNPGDGSDLIEGEAGEDDTLVINGSNASEIAVLSANGPRFSFFRNVGAVFLDGNGIEQVIFNAKGGADQMTISDLSGTQVTHVGLNLFAGAGSDTGDLQPDTVMITGTEGDDLITVSGSAAGVEILGLSAAVTVVGGESGIDELVIRALGGADLLNASGVQAGAIDFTLDGGSGADLLVGGEGNDLLIGAQGDDVLFGGAGDDTFVWNPGHGSDLVEGQAGHDTLQFNGSAVGEIVDLSANGERLQFFRNVANIVMDCDDVERVQFNALGGADTIVVNDLTGTDVNSVGLDLSTSASPGTGDNHPDAIVVNGTTGDDVVLVVGDPTGVGVFGLAAVVNIVGSEWDLDRLVINTLAGDDVVDASALQAGAIGLTADGGPDDDVLIGSDGNDVLLGGDGDDVLIGGPGLDVLDGGPGDNVVIQ
jgi:Ca2+-binding RTX toxin-like protein